MSKSNTGESKHDTDQKIRKLSFIAAFLCVAFYAFLVTVDQTQADNFQKAVFPIIGLSLGYSMNKK